LWRLAAVSLALFSAMTRIGELIRKVYADLKSLLIDLEAIEVATGRKQA